MFMSSPKPHSPYDTPRPYDVLYDPREISPPLGSVFDRRDRNPALLRNRYTHAADTLSPQAWQVIRAYYYSLITWLDEQFGRVLNWLEQKRITDRTLVVFTADHGDLVGDFGLIRAARELGDNTLLDGDRFRASTAFSDDPAQCRIRGAMGWRWY